MITKQIQLHLTVVLLCYWTGISSGHGLLWEPPGRSSMWRKGFNTPVNYQDNELSCGGFAYQVSKGYKCGLCGDRYGKTRENEAGGKYATGIISQSYNEGQRATFEVDITANHKGYFEFKICPTNDTTVPETQQCFDKNPVSLSDGSGTRYYPHQSFGIIEVDVQLPEGLTCDFCVLQWRYHTGNSWGREPNGTSCVGCGYQEEFYGCADIEILPTRSSHTNRTVNIPRSDSAAYQPTPRPFENETSNANDHYNNHLGNADNEMETICRGVNGQATLDNWCDMNCKLDYCPKTHCECKETPVATTPQGAPGCRASATYANVPGYDAWCSNNCAAGNCPTHICVCSK